MWFAAFLPFTYIWHFSPCYPSPTSLLPTVPPLVPFNRPQCVMFPSLCPSVLIVKHPPMSENMQCLIFCSCCQFAENDGFQVHPCPTKDTNSSIFDGCIIFHGVYVPHFSCPVYHWWAFRLVPGLCYCKQCCNEHSCACILYSRMIYRPLGIYPVMGLLGPVVYLFLGPWGITTLSSTMVELIYILTNSVRVFLFLHILSSNCLQIF